MKGIKKGGLMVLVIGFASALIFVTYHSRPAFCETLLIGGNAPMSGSAASFGIGQARALEKAIEEVNAKGGLNIGGVKYKLELKVYDNKGKADESVSIANKLILDEKVKYIMDAAVGATCRAIQTITAPNNVYFSFSCWGKMLCGPEVPLNWRVGFSPYEMSDAFIVGLSKANPKAKTIATISPNDTSGWDGAKGEIRAAEKVGIKSVAEIYYEREQQDFHSILGQILGKKPDIVDLGGTPAGTGGLILKQLHEMGYRGIKAWAVCSMASLAQEVAGKDAAEGLYIAVNWDYLSPKYTLPGLREFIKWYENKYKESLDYFGLTAYVNSKIVFSVMEKIQSIDPIKVSEGIMANQPYDTILGPVVYGNAEVYGLPRAMLHPLVLSKIEKGKVVNTSFGLHPDLAKVVGNWSFPK